MGGRSKRSDKTRNASRHAKNAQHSISAFSAKLRSGAYARGPMKIGSGSRNTNASSTTTDSPKNHSAPYRPK